MAHRLRMTVLLLTCAAGVSACAARGPVQCPTPMPPPPSVMQPPETEKRLHRELFESAPKPTPSSAPAKT